MIKRTNGVITMQKLKIFFLSLILIFAISTGVRAEFFSDVIVTSPNGIWTDSRSYTNLNDAVTAVGTVNQRTIVIASPQTVTALTVPSNITLRFERDGAIVNSGQLTINTKNIISDGHKIFAGLGDIDFASGTVVKLSWFHDLWNALTMTSDDHVTMVIDKAINATASVAVGNDVTLRWEAPNIITANAGVTVSNIGQIEAGSYQILAGAGNFRFRDGVSLNLEWFPYLRMALTWIDTTDATIVVNESSDVDYSDSVPLNIQLKINNGGALDIAPGVTLTIANSKQIDIGPCLFDPFTGTGSVTITGGTTYTPATILTATALCTLSMGGYEVDALMSYGDGTAYTKATIDAALTAIGTTNKATLLLRPGTWVISVDADYSAYANVTWKLPAGTLIQITSGKTLTIGGPLDAGRYQVFNCVGTGSVVFGSGSVMEVYPEWWGVDGIADEVQINAALASINVGVVKLSAITYNITSTIFKDSAECAVSIVGSGNYPSIVFAKGTNLAWKGGSSDSVVRLSSFMSLKDMFIYNGNSATDVIGIDCLGDSSQGIVANKISNVSVKSFSVGIAFNFAWYTTLYDVSVLYCGIGFDLRMEANNINFYNCHISACTIGITDENTAGGSARQMLWSGGSIEGCTAYGIKTRQESTIAWVFLNPYLEKNYQHLINGHIRIDRPFINRDGGEGTRPPFDISSAADVQILSPYMSSDITQLFTISGSASAYASKGITVIAPYDSTEVAASIYATPDFLTRGYIDSLSYVRVETPWYDASGAIKENIITSGEADGLGASATLIYAQIIVDTLVTVTGSNFTVSMGRSATFNEVATKTFTTNVGVGAYELPLVAAAPMSIYPAAFTYKVTGTAETSGKYKVVFYFVR